MRFTIPKGNVEITVHPRIMDERDDDGSPFTVLGRFTGEQDTTGKFTFEPLNTKDYIGGPILYLFEDEFEASSATIRVKRAVTAEDLQQFCADQADRLKEHNLEMGFTSSIHDAVIEFQVGPRYARIVNRKLHGKSTSVVCFIDRGNGDILKAGSYKAPAKNGVRGNLFTEDREPRA